MEITGALLVVAMAIAMLASIASTLLAQSAAQPAQRATRPPEAASGQAAQTARVVTGTLTCRGSGTVGLILGSKQRLTCVFERSKDSTTSKCSATITRIGLDIGVTGRNVMIWTVLASTDNLPASALAGRYAGVAANASVGAGVGANASSVATGTRSFSGTAECAGADGRKHRGRTGGPQTDRGKLIYDFTRSPPTPLYLAVTKAPYGAVACSRDLRPR